MPEENKKSYAELERELEERRLTDLQVQRQFALLQAINRIFREIPGCETEEEMAQLGLKVAAGGEGTAEREIRWVHLTELLDPTPWLSGGELLLTTGIRLENAASAAQVGSAKHTTQ